VETTRFKAERLAAAFERAAEKTKRAPSSRCRTMSLFLQKSAAMRERRIAGASGNAARTSAAVADSFCVQNIHDLAFSPAEMMFDVHDVLIFSIKSVPVNKNMLKF